MRLVTAGGAGLVDMSGVTCRCSVRRPPFDPPAVTSNPTWVSPVHAESRAHRDWLTVTVAEVGRREIAERGGS